MIVRKRQKIQEGKKKQYRSQEEIITLILTIIKEEKGVRTTKLMFLSAMSNKQLKKYLDNLLQNGLIVMMGAPTHRGRGRQGQTFHITTKGLSYLQMVDEMKRNTGLNI